MDRIRCLAPAPDGGDDFIGIGDAGEGRGFLIALFEESIDGGPRIDDRSEEAALEPALGARGEDAFGGVEKADELLTPATPHVLADDRAVATIHGGEQRRRAVPDVVMGHRAGAALLERQPGLDAIEGLNWALLIERKDDGARRRIAIEPNDVAQLLDEFGIVGQFELPHAARLKTMLAPEALNGADGDARGLRHQSAGPARRLSRRRIARQGRHPRNDLRRQRLDARGPRRVARRPVEPFVGEPFLPAPEASRRFARLAHDFVRAYAVGRQKHDLAPPNGLLRRVAILDRGQRPAPIFRRNGKRYSCANAPDAPIANPLGICKRIRSSDLIHE